MVFFLGWLSFIFKEASAAECPLFEATICVSVSMAAIGGSEYTLGLQSEIVLKGTPGNFGKHSSAAYVV